MSTTTRALAKIWLTQLSWMKRAADAVLRHKSEEAKTDDCGSSIHHHNNIVSTYKRKVVKIGQLGYNILTATGREGRSKNHHFTPMPIQGQGVGGALMNLGTRAQFDPFWVALNDLWREERRVRA